MRAWALGPTAWRAAVTGLALTVAASASAVPARFAVRARTFDGVAWHDAALVAVAGDRIESVSVSDRAPASGPLIEIPGSVLTPGFIDCDSALGLTDGRDELPEAASPDLLVADAFAPDGSESAAFRASGVTLAWLAPGPVGVIGGRGALVQPGPASPRVLVRAHGLGASLTADASLAERVPSSTAEQVRLLRAAPRPDAVVLRVRFDDSASARLAAGTPDAVPVGLPSDESLVELRQASAIVISGMDATTPLAILRPTVELVRTIPFALGSDTSATGPRAIRLAAARLVEAGAPPDRVLAALTSEAGRLASAGGRGVIAAGRPADLVLWSGSPLSPASRVLRAWVAGVEVHREE